ncbi:MAG: cytochrome c [Gammaproteobacteria bacterium]|nr:MAG: cytochrome c [Gammaproteobacteria bacterium]
MSWSGLTAIVAAAGLGAAVPDAWGGDLAEDGALVFARACVVCHAPGTPSTAMLQDRYKDSVPALLEERTDMTPEYVRSVVRSWRPRMPAFRPTEVSDEELAALAAYLTRNNRPRSPPDVTRQ